MNVAGARAMVNRKRNLKLDDRMIYRRSLFSLTVREATSKHDDMDFVRNGARLLEELISSCQGNTNPIRIFSANELAAATDNYHEDRFVGRGISLVYRGTEDGQSFAVKVFITGDFSLFINEAVSLSQVNHKNVVRLLGCCIETRAPILVFEFVSNGTLHDYFCMTDPSLQIPWAIHLRIATEVADALAYLHIALRRPIVHKNIKSSSILLDEQYSAKISTFGFAARIMEQGKQPTSYIPADPGYDSMQYLSAKNDDVYDFGVVLIELLTRKEPWVKEAEREQYVACRMLALKCTEESKEEMPTMKEVVQELRRIKKLRYS